CLQYNTLPLTF
nr:immunoglobulin light chain junction region [Macaca mulatta]